jgi:hypothetical protein
MQKLWDFRIGDRAVSGGVLSFPISAASSRSVGVLPSFSDILPFSRGVIPQRQDVAQTFCGVIQLP